MKKVLALSLFFCISSTLLYAQQIDSAKLAKALRFDNQTIGGSPIVKMDSNYRYVVNETILTWNEYVAFPKDALPEKGITILHDKASLKKYHAENKKGVVIFHD